MVTGQGLSWRSSCILAMGHHNLLPSMTHVFADQNRASHLYRAACCCLWPPSSPVSTADVNPNSNDIHPPHAPLLQSNQLLRAGRMYSDATIKVLFGGAHLDRDAEALQHLRRTDTQDMQAHDPLVLARTDDLVARRAFLLRLHHGIIHGGETRLIDLDVLVAVLPPRVGLAEADGADLRVREDDGRDVGVVELDALVLGPAKQAVGQLAARRNGDGRQLHFAADVAERVDVGDGGVLELVGDDLRALVLLHAGFVEAQVFDFGAAPDGPQDAVDVQHARPVGVGVVEFHPSVVGLGGGLFEFGLGGAAVDLHALALVFLGDGVLDHGVEVAEEGVVADEEVGLGAEGVEHAGQLDGDVAGADDGDFLGLALEVEEAVAGDAQLAAGDVRRFVGVSAGGEQDVLGFDRRLGAVVQHHLGFVLRQQVRPAVYVLDLVVV